MCYSGNLTHANIRRLASELQVIGSLLGFAWIAVWLCYFFHVYYCAFMAYGLSIITIVLCSCHGSMIKVCRTTPETEGPAKSARNLQITQIIFGLVVGSVMLTWGWQSLIAFSVALILTFLNIIFAWVMAGQGGRLKKAEKSLFARLVVEAARSKSQGQEASRPPPPASMSGPGSGGSVPMAQVYVRPAMPQGTPPPLPPPPVQGHRPGGMIVINAAMLESEDDRRQREEILRRHDMYAAGGGPSGAPPGATDYPYQGVYPPAYSGEVQQVHIGQGYQPQYAAPSAPPDDTRMFNPYG